MRKIIKAISLVMICSLILPLGNVMVYAENTSSTLSFENGIVSNGISTSFGGDIVQKDGINCITINPDSANTNFDFNFGGSMSHMNDGSCIELDITYFDEGEGKFCFSYDGKNGKTLYPGYVQLKNTGRWKTESYYLHNPKFSGRISGADGRISVNTTYMGKSAAKVYISKISARKTDTKSLFDISLTSKNTGNIFFSDEDIVFDIKPSPIKGQQPPEDNYTVTYSVTDEAGNEVWSQKNENVSLKFARKYQYTLEKQKFGIYYFHITIEHESGIKTKESTYFSYVKRARKNPKFGVSTHYSHSYPNSNIGAELLGKSGIGFARDGVYWHSYEKKKGEYSLSDSKQLADFFVHSNENDVDTLFVAAYGNKLYTGHMYHMPVTPEEIDAYVNYCVEIVKEVNPEYIEIWNEPNGAAWTKNQPGFVVYTNILKALYPRVKEINPDIKVIGLALIAIPKVPMDIIETVYNEGGFDYMDAVSIHPYMWQGSPINSNFDEKIRELDDYLKEKGYKDKEIWITELGWSSGPSQSFTFDQQAAYLVQSNIIANSFETFGTYTWYDFQNDDVQIMDKEANFGLVTRWDDSEPWKAKQSFVGAANMNDIMSGAEYVDKSDDGNDAYAYHYKNDGRDIYALFSKNDGQQVAFSSNNDKVTIIDFYGNESELCAVDGVLNFISEEQPMYIVGENLTLSFTKPTIEISDTAIDLIFGEDAEISVNSSLKEAKTEITAMSEDIKIESNDNKQFKISLVRQKENAEKIYITVKQDEAVLLSGRMQVTYIDPVTSSITNDVYSDKNFNRWVGTLTVKNNSLTNSIKGSLTFLEPTKFTKLKPVKIPEIQPQGTVTVKFHFPEILRKEACNLVYLIKLDSGYKRIFADRIDFAVATYAENKPIIDGVIEPDEWVMGSAMAFDRKEQAIMNTGYAWDGKEDLSGNVCIMYDEDYFYLGARVVDDVMFQNQTGVNTWQGDSIQFATAYLRANGSEGSTAYTEVCLSLTEEGEQVYNHAKEDAATITGLVDFKKHGGELVIKRDKNVTTYELKQPWDLITPKGSDISGGKNLAFSMLVNDNDGLGRKGWLEYASGIGLSKNINLFTFLKLMNKNDI